MMIRRMMIMVYIAMGMTAGVTAKGKRVMSRMWMIKLMERRSISIAYFSASLLLTPFTLASFVHPIFIPFSFPFPFVPSASPPFPSSSLPSPLFPRHFPSPFSVPAPRASSSPAKGEEKSLRRTREEKERKEEEKKTSHTRAETDALEA